MRLPSTLRGRQDVVLDTMVFIYLFEDTPKYASLCESLLGNIGKGYFSGVVTPITSAEILVKPLKERRNDIADRYRSALRSMPNIKPVSIGFEVGALAGAMRAKYGLPLPDMMQVALALQGSRPAMITNDKALKKIEELDVFLLDEMGRT